MFPWSCHGYCYILHLTLCWQSIFPPSHLSWLNNQPNHLATATQSQINAANHHYNTLLVHFCLYMQVREALCQQILLAIDLHTTRYLRMSHLDIQMSLFLPSLCIWKPHMLATLVSADDLKWNQMRLAAVWNPDKPLETYGFISNISMLL